MEIKIKSYSSQSSLLSSILFFIIGAILCTNADKVLLIICKMVGIFLAYVAIVEFLIYFINRKNEMNTPLELIKAIIYLLFSLLFLFKANIIEQLIRFIVGAWILFSGINRLINVLSISNKSNKFIPLLIVAILLIIIGIYTIVVGDIILSTIGIIMMIYAAIDIVGYVFYRKDSQEVEDEGSTTLIVPQADSSKEETTKTKKRTKTVKNKEDSKKKSTGKGKGKNKNKTDSK